MTKNYLGKYSPKAKRSYVENLDIRNLSDSRTFWGTVKLLFFI